MSGLSARSLSFSYSAEHHVLRDVDLHLPSGGSISIMGPSGAGKSTLLYCLGGLLPPTSGSVVVDGICLSDLDGDELVDVRREVFGFVFQQSLLVPEVDLLTNVALPLLASGRSRRLALDEASTMLAQFGLAAAANSLPAKVSGGQAQRAAVARALINRPRYLLADEPTGALDSVNAAQVIDSLLSEDLGATLIIVTHNPEIAARADAQFVLEDGRLVG